MRSTRDADFDEFFRAVYPAVYRTALWILGDRGDAEDAAIEALTPVGWRLSRTGYSVRLSLLAYG